MSEHSDKPLFGLETPTFDDAPDISRRKEIIQKAMPPSGFYETDPEAFGPLMVFTSAKDFDDTRRMVTLSGRFRGIFKGKEVTAFVRNIKLSPDRRPAKEFKEGKPTGNFLDKDDTASLLWAKAEDAFVKTYKEEPASRQAVIDFLTDKHYRVKIRAFNGELYVNDIVPSKNGR